ncbi:MAG: NADPH-dependent FMN reductase [Chitinivibrionales bacterium]
MHILVICGSTRRGRQTPLVSEYLFKKLQEYRSVTAEYFDLKYSSIPFLEERLKYLKNPPESVADFSRRVRRAETLLIVTPEYNGGFPGVLKNALDYLTDEYAGKSAGIATVSAGRGGKSSSESLATQLSRLDAKVISRQLHITNVMEAFTKEGEVRDTGLQDEINEFIIKLAGIKGD